MKIITNAVLAHCTLCYFTINVGIGTYFVYYKYTNCDKKANAKERFYFLNINY